MLAVEERVAGESAPSPGSSAHANLGDEEDVRPLSRNAPFAEWFDSASLIHKIRVFHLPLDVH
jgi:hypothetical protein